MKRNGLSLQANISKIGRFLLVYVLIPLACGLASWWLGQDISWDIQNYHLYNPYAFLHDRHSFDLMPAGTQSLFSPLLDLFWYGLVHMVPPVFAGSILGVIHGLNFVLLLLIGREVLPQSRYQTGLAWGLAVLGILSVGFRSELGTGMHDNLVSLFILASLLAILHALRSSHSSIGWKAVFSAGLLAGLACASKLTMGSYALGLCFALLINSLWMKQLRWYERLYPALVFSLGVMSAFIVFAGPHYYQNWQEFGNPLYPLYNQLFGSELADLSMIKDERFVPHSISAFLLRPIWMSINPFTVSELPYYQYTGIVILAVVACWIGGLCMNKRAGKQALVLIDAQRILLWFMLCSYLLWLGLFSYYRYLISWELLAPLAMALLIVNLLGSRVGALVSCVVLPLLAAINFYGAPDWGRSPWASTFYRVEAPAELEKVSSVLLMGSPLGWLVPGLDIDVPFIQIDPNYPVRKSAYGLEALRRMDTSGQIKVIYDAAVYNAPQVVSKLQQGGYQLDASSCLPLQAWLGSQAFTYQYCNALPPN